MKIFQILYHDCGTHVIQLHSGKYLFEVWGAEGGGEISTSCYGGKGAYAKGEIYFSENTTIFANIGENNELENNQVACNGGGAPNCKYSGNFHAFSGGGSSDIRINNNKLQYRVIVAAGGGGAAMYSGSCGSGGDAGSKVGFNGKCSSIEGCNKFGIGGSQDSGGAGNEYGDSGAFGFGGNNTSYNQFGGGGGGGWFGGSAGKHYGSGGGGGSSFAFDGQNSNYQLLNKIYKLHNIKVLAGNEVIPNPFEEKGLEVGHSGNGVVRITLLQNREVQFKVPLSLLSGLFAILVLSKVN